jgi:hypothetical protein
VKEFTTKAGAQVLLMQAQAARPTLNVFRGLDPDAISPDHSRGCVS